MIRHSISLTLLLFLMVSCASEKPQDRAAPERKQLFDFNWKFALGDIQDAKANDYDDGNWRDIDLPHDWSIEGEIDQNNPSSVPGGYFPTGTGWYRKSFQAPVAWKNKRVSIYFEGVYMNAEVFVNGNPAGIHPYGYTSFYYDITPFLKYDEENVIAVRVDNSKQTNCRWYTGSGIYRHVWLITTDPVHVAHWGVAISTPDVSQEKATVRVKTIIKNETNTAQSIMLSTKLTDKDTRQAGAGDLQVELGANDEKEVIQTLTVDHPLLWSPGNPDLYQAEIEVIRGNKIIDRTTHSFGIRSIAFTAEQGFLLNGEKIVLNGGNVHHDNGSLGAKAYDRAEERKAELLKSAGFNAVRTAHNPPSEAFLDACDRLGLLVIDEAFDGWRQSKEPHAPYDYSIYFDEWWQRDLESMVLRDRNHPSVIMWSIGNEIIERTKPEAVETAKKLADCVRQIDPTRPVTSAMTTWGQGWEIFDPLMAAHDITGYNYQMHRAESDHERVPSRIIVHTESYPKEAFYLWDMAQKHDYIIGDFVWTAMDYLGESSIGRYYYPGEPDGEHWEGDYFPWHGAYCGDIDLTGWRKPVSHYRNLLWNDTEKLYLAVREPNPESGEIKLTAWAVWPTWESWTWPGQEGKGIQVEVYSKYPAVRLYLNGELIGEKATGKTEEFKALFTLPYEPGELKAVGVEEGKEVESTALQTAGRPSAIQLTPDRSTLLADGQDLSFVTVEITDGSGNRQPHANNRLIFTIEGPGEIIGIDNGNLKDTTRYVGSSRKAWNGRAVVVVKSALQAGDIKLKASSPGLTGAAAVIGVKK